MPNSRKSISLVVVIVVSIAVIVAMRLIPTKRPQLNIYNWTEYIPQEVIDTFSKEYGVRVNYDTYSSNEEMMAKLATGAGGYDIIVPSDYAITVMANKDLLLPLNKSLIPNMANLDPQFLNLQFDPANKWSVPYMWGTIGIAVNTDKVKEKITRLEDLWNPSLKGRIVLPDDPREVIGLALQILGKSRNSTDERDLLAAKAKLQSLMPLVKAFDSDSPKSLLLSGEVYVGVVWSGEAALAAMENPKITYVIPAEGGGIWMDNLAIPKSSRHPELAHQFIDFMLRPDISAKLSQAYPYGNPNLASHALTDPAILKNPASYPPMASLKKAEWLIDVGSATTTYDRIWTELKGEQ